MTIRGGGDTEVIHGCNTKLEECARRPGALPPKRMIASMVRTRRGSTPEYKVAAQYDTRSAKAGSLRSVSQPTLPWPPGRGWTHTNPLRNAWRTMRMPRGCKPARRACSSATPSGRPAIGRATTIRCQCPSPDIADPPIDGSRSQRWACDARQRIGHPMQPEYVAWLDSLPDSLRATPTGESLQAIADLDLDALAEINPPRGYGRGLIRLLPPQSCKADRQVMFRTLDEKSPRRTGRRQ